MDDVMLDGCAVVVAYLFVSVWTVLLPASCQPLMLYLDSGPQE